MAVESARAIAWVTSVLSTDATFMAEVPGGVNIGAAPPDTPFPVCAVWVQSAPDLNTLNGIRVWSDGHVMVKISGPSTNGGTGGLTPLVTAADRADTLLQRKQGAAQGGTILACVREDAFPLAEPQLINGEQWVSLVQMYQILAQ